MKRSTVINLEKVSKNYETNHRGNNDIPVLRKLSLKVEEGDSVAVTGPSGSGKSTLLNLIGTLDRADSGKIELLSRDISTLSDTELAKLRLNDIGFVFQLHYLLPQCTVLENVLLPTLPVKNGHHPESLRSRAIELLQKLGMESRKDHRPAQISVGERQRAAIARALINRPQLLLADEPTGSLDRKTAKEIIKLLVELNREDNVTLVVVTHSPELASYMQKNYELLDGSLEQVL